MPISRTLEPGDVGTMPPRSTPRTGAGMRLMDLTRRQLVTLCEMRGVPRFGKHQAKAYYIEKLKAIGNDAPPTDDEIEQLS